MIADGRTVGQVLAPQTGVQGMTWHGPWLHRHSQALVRDFVGYDTVVMNWLISLYKGKGFLYGVRNSELFNLNYAAEFIESTEVRQGHELCPEMTE